MKKATEVRDNRIQEPELTAQLQAYGQSDYYPLHMPGHKRRAYGKMPEAVYQMDITEIDGFDNLHQPEGVLRRLQERASFLYGAEESFCLINGSTCGILSAISAAVPENGHILMARNCHKSVYHACYLRRLRISYLYPEILEEYDICEAITARQIETALKQQPDVDAVLIVSPTYEGRIADVAAIAKVVHGKGIPLIVDEAHGAHLGFFRGFAQGSCRQGADLVIHSVHKTLPAMTQTALLHVNGNLVDRGKLRRFLHIFQSSSPSYVLMAGIENALWQIETDTEGLFGRFYQDWQWMMTQLSACHHLQIIASSQQQDIGKLLISVKKTCLSGQQLYDMLLQEYHLQLEMAAPTYVLAMFTVGDIREGFERTVRALLQIDAELGERQWAYNSVIATDALLQKNQSDTIPFFEAWDKETVWCPIETCEGRYAGGFVNLYPPGVPLVVPGEGVSRELINRIMDYQEMGLNVQGVEVRDGQTVYMPVLM